MNTKIIPVVAIVASGLSVMLGMLTWQQQTTISQAMERARKAENALWQTTDQEEEDSWKHLEHYGAILSSPDLKEAERKEAHRRFREILRGLKSRCGYPQLRARSDP